MSQQIAILKDLNGRDLIAQRTAEEALALHLSKESRTLYCGFDPTADSLHIGSLVPLISLRRFQLAGHRPIALVGGGTGLIGDPSGKTQERTLNELSVVGGWADKIKAQVSPFLDFDAGKHGAKVANNLEWLGQLSLIDLLRDVGKHFSVNAMIQKESVKQRIQREGEGITLTEFSYMVLQAIDFVQLNKREGCTLQLGGSDQWGNITAGIELGRRKGCGELFGLTQPLVTKADGTKFGKTEAGTIWLDAKKTSPYSFYQFWLNTADSDVYRFLKYFTFLPLSEIQAIQVADQGRSKPEAQASLAREVTTLVHGESGYLSAQRISAALFGSDIGGLTEDDFKQLALDGAPTCMVAVGVGLLDVLVNSGLANSKRHAREFISSGAVRLNGEIVQDAQAVLAENHFLFGKYVLAKRGKKNLCLLIKA